MLTVLQTKEANCAIAMASDLVRKCINFSPSRNKLIVITSSSCGLDLRYVEPDAFPYEPQDIIIGMGHDTYRDYCLESRSGNSRDPRKKYNCDTQHKAARYSSKRRFKDSEIPVDLVCRRITLKWEPIFNMTYRYLHCRCVVRPSTPSRLQEEMTFFVCFPCPRHNDRGVSFLDYGNIDYHQDPYFDRFGGYDCFRAMIRLYGENIYTILGGTKFLGQEEADAAIDALIELDETHQGAVRSFLREYWFEVNEHLQSSGYDLPKEVVQYLEQEKLKRNKEESELSERMSRVRLPRRDASEIPMSREVLEILDGKWSGRPHWAVDRQRGEGIGH